MPNHTRNASAASQSRQFENYGFEILSLDTLTIGTLIGEGRFKSVYAGYHDDHGAVALLRYESESERNEASILKLLALESSVYVPEVFCGFMDPSGCLLLAQEVSMMGSVRSILKDPDLGPLLTPAHKLNVATQIASAISFLESSRIIHADISCRNVLIFDLEDQPELTTAKITDFGCAIYLPHGLDQIERRQPQATRWCAPETVAFGEWSFKTDVWSLGATLWELFAGGASPWTRHAKRAAVAAKLKQLAYSEIEIDMQDEFPAPDPRVYPDVVNAIVLSCLRFDASMRPAADAVMLALEPLVDVVDAFNGSSADINKGLDYVCRGASTVRHEPPALPAQERSRACRSSPRDPLEPSPSPTCGSTSFWQHMSASSGHSGTRTPTPSSSRLSASESTPPKPQHKIPSHAISTPSTVRAISTTSTTATPLTPDEVEMHGKVTEKYRPLVQCRQQNEQLFSLPYPSSDPKVYQMAPKGDSPYLHQGIPVKRQEARVLPTLLRNSGSSPHIMPLKPTGHNSWGIDAATASEGLENDKWTLWTYLPPALQREDFSSESEARHALQSRQIGPHVLRDPLGREMHASAWNTTAQVSSL